MLDLFSDISISGAAFGEVENFNGHDILYWKNDHWVLIFPLIRLQLSPTFLFERIL